MPSKQQLVPSKQLVLSSMEEEGEGASRGRGKGKGKAAGGPEQKVTVKLWGNAVVELARRLRVPVLQVGACACGS